MPPINYHAVVRKYHDGGWTTVARQMAHFPIVAQLGVIYIAANIVINHPVRVITTHLWYQWSRPTFYFQAYLFSGVRTVAHCVVYDSDSDAKSFGANQFHFYQFGNNIAKLRWN